MFKVVFYSGKDIVKQELLTDSEYESVKATVLKSLEEKWMESKENEVNGTLVLSSSITKVQILYIPPGTGNDKSRYSEDGDEIED